MLACAARDAKSVAAATSHSKRYSTLEKWVARARTAGSRRDRKTSLKWFRGQVRYSNSLPVPRARKNLYGTVDGSERGNHKRGTPCQDDGSQHGT